MCISLNWYQNFCWFLQNILFSFYWYHKLVSWCIDTYLRTWLLYLSIGIIMFWFVMLICKGSLTSSLYIDQYVLIYAYRKKIIYYAFLLFAPLCWWIDKKGEKYFGVYMHVCLKVFRYTFISFQLVFVIFYHWHQEHFLLVSRASFVGTFVSIKSMFYFIGIN